MFERSPTGSKCRIQEESITRVKNGELVDSLRESTQNSSGVLRRGWSSTKIWKDPRVVNWEMHSTQTRSEYGIDLCWIRSIRVVRNDQVPVHFHNASPVSDVFFFAGHWVYVYRKRSVVSMHVIQMD